MTRLFTTIAALTALGTASAQVPEAWKDWPPEVFDRVALVQPSIPPPVADVHELAPVTLGTAATAAEWVRTVAEDGAGLLRAVSNAGRLMLARLGADDDSSPVWAWLRQQDRKTLVRLAEQMRWQPCSGCDMVLRTLVAEGHVSGRGWMDLPNAVILKLANHWRELLDDRCVALYQHLLSRRAGPTDQSIPELYGLGSHYMARGQFESAAALYLSAPSYTKHRTQLANLTFDAAAAYAALGDIEAAESAYGRVAQYGEAWSTGMATVARALMCMDQRQWDGARKLLMAAQGAPNSDEVRVPLLWALACTHYFEGDLDRAAELLRQALSLYDSVRKVAPYGTGLVLAEFADKAQTALAAIGRWREQPFECLPTPLVVPSVGHATAKALLVIRSPCEIALNVSAQDPRVRIAPPGQWTRARHSLYFRRDVEVEVAPVAAADQLVTSITVESPRYPGFRLAIPVVRESASTVTRAEIGRKRPGTGARDAAGAANASH